MNAALHQMTADLRTKKTGIGRESTYRQLVNHIHHLHIITTQPTADTHFTVPGRAEEIVYTPIIVIPNMLIEIMRHN